MLEKSEVVKTIKSNPRKVNIPLNIVEKEGVLNGKS